MGFSKTDTVGKNFSVCQKFGAALPSDLVLPWTHSDLRPVRLEFVILTKRVNPSRSKFWIHALTSRPLRNH